MEYHIDTGLIVEKFNSDSVCPLCEIQKIIEEQYVFEFLNDAVMEDNTRIEVGKKGFCNRHFDMLFARPNKLSVALQVRTRAEKMQDLLSPVKNVKSALKKADEIEKSFETCIICDYVQESMVKYYKTIAQMFMQERTFCKTLISSKGFCMHHYAELLRYAKYAGLMSKNYVEVLSSVQKRGFTIMQEQLKEFCDKHDYRNANLPLGSAENALPNARIKLYGKKID